MLLILLLFYKLECTNIRTWIIVLDVIKIGLFKVAYILLGILPAFIHIFLSHKFSFIAYFNIQFSFFYYHIIVIILAIAVIMIVLIPVTQAIWFDFLFSHFWLNLPGFLKLLHVSQEILVTLIFL